MKLSQAVDLFLVGVRADGLSDQTEIWYRKRLSRLVCFLNDAALETITVDDLRRFIVSLRDQTCKYQDHSCRKPVNASLSPYTVEGYVRVIRRLFHWLELNEHTEQNIAARLKKPSLPKLPPKETTIEDIRALLEAAQKSPRYAKRDRALVLFLADTGCRKAGLLGLRVSDVFLEKGSALVTEKGNKSRFVHFGLATKQALQDWLAERPKETDYVFVSKRGRFGEHGVNLLLERLKKRAGVHGRVNPHSFRHSFAKRYLINGGDLASLADLMGHSTVEVTKNSYSVFLIEELKRKHDQHNPLAGIVDNQ